MIRRRGFMLLLGATVSGLWLPAPGLLELPRRLVLRLAGTCSFCAKAAAEVSGLVGILGRTQQVCDQCIALCRDILSESAVPIADRPPPPWRGKLAMTEQLERAIALLQQSREELVAEIRRELTGMSLAPIDHSGPLSCSFCDAPHRAVRKLVAGPAVFVCDSCVGDAASILGAHLRA